MAHATQREYIGILAERLPGFFRDCRVLEVGSLDINGSIRDFYKNCAYIGLDIGAGKGVDVVCEGQKYDAPDNSFDHVISCEVMEHNPHWVPTFKNMVRLCRPGGLVVMTCAATGRVEHGTTRTTAADSPLTTEAGWDYYRNLTKEDFASQIALDADFSSYFLDINWGSYDLCFCGIKRGPAVTADENAAMVAAIQAVRVYIDGTNSAALCRVRKTFAAIVGDRGFEMARSIRSKF